jgi:hypothetical protein
VGHRRIAYWAIFGEGLCKIRKEYKKVGRMDDQHGGGQYVHAFTLLLCCYFLCSRPIIDSSTTTFPFTIPIHWPTPGLVRPRRIAMKVVCWVWPQSWLFVDGLPATDDNRSWPFFQILGNNFCGQRASLPLGPFTSPGVGGLENGVGCLQNHFLQQPPHPPFGQSNKNSII